MEAAPEKAKERREQAAKDARVERWAEDSGNAALMGCELPPDEVLAADQRITAWAQELRKAGLEGGMDQLRARAFLDLLLGKDSRPRRDASGGADGTGPGPGGSGPAGPDASPPSAGPAGGAVPIGFAGRVTLTVPLATVTGLADRPGEIPGIGPVDPNPGANTSDCYRSQERADPARAAHPPPRTCRTPLPLGRDARRAANRLVLGMKGLAYVLCRRASFPWHGILLNWLR